MPHFLLLSKWPAPCVYAARAKPDGAKLSFAFIVRKLEYMSILFQPHQKYTLYTCGGAVRYRPAVQIPFIALTH